MHLLLKNGIFGLDRKAGREVVVAVLILPRKSVWKYTESSDVHNIITLLIYSLCNHPDVLSLLPYLKHLSWLKKKFAWCTMK